MTVFNGGNEPDIQDGLLNLHAVRQMLFCISQEDSAAQELDAYSMLGISNILEEVGYQIEQNYNKLIYKQEAAIKRHNKLRAALAAYVESEMIFGKSDIAKILAGDERGVDNAN